MPPRRKVEFDGLLTILRDKALALEAKNRTRYLRVIGIDATPPVNFRDAKKAPARKRAKGAAPAKLKLTAAKKPAVKATRKQGAAKRARRVVPAKKNASAWMKKTHPQKASAGPGSAVKSESNIRYKR